MADLLHVVSVGCGREHTAAVVSGGAAYSWGWGVFEMRRIAPLRGSQSGELCLKDKC